MAVFKRSKTPKEPVTPATETLVDTSIEIPPGDQLELVLVDAGGPVDLTENSVASPAAQALRDAGVELVVPLVSRGELIGTLNLGQRRSDQPYSTDDRRLLSDLSSQVAPAIRVAQLVREQQDAASERERIEQELQVASLIQQTLLPKELPNVPGWEIDAFYRPARAVGGDFYDYIAHPDGRLGIIIGDVTDKGVPAALVMATCRSTLRAASERSDDPAVILADVNEALVDEIPPAMFVTCLYMVLDPASGKVTFANAGHNLPYVRTTSGVIELRATGMPLGLMPGSDYDVHTAIIEPGELVLLSSDGIVEAHNPNGEMYGFPRLMGRVAAIGPNGDLLGDLITDLDAYAGVGAEQEDDVTLVSIRRLSSARDAAETFMEDSTTLTAFSVSSVFGNEREVMDRVTAAVGDELPEDRLQRLQTAVSETAMNAIEHGNRAEPELLVDVEVVVIDDRLVVSVTDHGGSRGSMDVEKPDLEAKLAGEQSPRGWGLFLIEEMVDDLSTVADGDDFTVRLTMNLKDTPELESHTMNSKGRE